MSRQPALDPVCSEPARDGIVTVIDSHPRDLGDMHVRRLLPSLARKMVGPFTFFDEMGPAAFAPGMGVDVRPHPHIGLATVTYLFEGEIHHRDSLGTSRVIRPGAINWMTAGRGIVHSERTPAAERGHASRLHGLQLWVALPREHEEDAPSFRHYEAESLPERLGAGLRVRVLAGEAFGLRSPVETHSPLFYVDAWLDAGSTIELPVGYAERAIYVVDGEVEFGASAAGNGRMLVFAADAQPVFCATRPTRMVFFGGAPLEGPRFIDWNFVSSTRERIERAKQAWVAGEFPRVPGDADEFIPLPG